MNQIATAIRVGRAKKNIKQNELAKILDVSPAAISVWEKGERVPSGDTLLKIAKILDIVDELFPEYEIKKKGFGYKPSLCGYDSERDRTYEPITEEFEGLKKKSWRTYYFIGETRIYDDYGNNFVAKGKDVFFNLCLDFSNVNSFRAINANKVFFGDKDEYLMITQKETIRLYKCLAEHKIINNSNPSEVALNFDKEKGIDYLIKEIHELKKEVHLLKKNKALQTLLEKDSQSSK